MPADRIWPLLRITGVRFGFDAFLFALHFESRAKLGLAHGHNAQRDTHTPHTTRADANTVRNPLAPPPAAEVIYDSRSSATEIAMLVDEGGLTERKPVAATRLATYDVECAANRRHSNTEHEQRSPTTEGRTAARPRRTGREDQAPANRGGRTQA